MCDKCNNNDKRKHLEVVDPNNIDFCFFKLDVGFKFCG